MTWANGTGQQGRHAFGIQHVWSHVMDFSRGDLERSGLLRCQSNGVPILRI